MSLLLAKRLSEWCTGRTGSPVVGQAKKSGLRKFGFIPLEIKGPAVIDLGRRQTLKSRMRPVVIVGDSLGYFFFQMIQIPDLVSEEVVILEDFVKCLDEAVGKGNIDLGYKFSDLEGLQRSCNKRIVVLRSSVDDETEVLGQGLGE